MKKSDFITLVFGIVGTLVFGVGLCMCLLPEWNLFNEGVGVTAVGGVVLLVLLFKTLKSKMSGKSINWKTVGKVLFGTLGCLVLGLGMSMIMVMDMLLAGIVVGIVGIVLLLCLIPMCVGLK